MSDEERTTTTIGTDDTPTAGRRAPARVGTVLWGVLLLVFAATMAVSVLPAVHVDPTTLVLGACIAAGVLLVAAGVAAMVTRPDQDDRPPR